MIKQPNKILVIRSGAIGDVIMTTPLVKSIRKRFPKANISYLVGKWSKKAVESNPNIDNIIAFDDDIVFKKKISRIFSLIGKLRKKKFDLCFILDKSYLWNLFAFLCNIKTRIGFNRNWEGFINTLNVDYKGTKNELDYYLDIAKLLGIEPKEKTPELFPTKKDKEFTSGLIEKNKLKNKVVIGIAPGGAENPGQKLLLKRWPKDKYTELIKELVKKQGIILFGGNDDKGVCSLIKKSVKGKIINTAGKLTIKQSAALIGKCSLFITHDSGPMHIASTTKTPVIAIFGPTDPKRFAPKNAVVIRKNIDCSPCYDAKGNYKKCIEHDCMESIDVKEILDEAKRILRE